MYASFWKPDAFGGCSLTLLPETRTVRLSGECNAAKPELIPMMIYFLSFLQKSDKNYQNTQVGNTQ